LLVLPPLKASVLNTTSVVKMGADLELVWSRDARCKVCEGRGFVTRVGLGEGRRREQLTIEPKFRGRGVILCVDWEIRIRRRKWT